MFFQTKYQINYYYTSIYQTYSKILKIVVERFKSNCTYIIWHHKFSGRLFLFHLIF